MCAALVKIGKICAFILKLKTLQAYLIVAHNFFVQTVRRSSSCRVDLGVLISSNLKITLYSEIKIDTFKRLHTIDLKL